MKLLEYYRPRWLIRRIYNTFIYKISHIRTSRCTVRERVCVCVFELSQCLSQTKEATKAYKKWADLGPLSSKLWRAVGLFLQMQPTRVCIRVCVYAVCDRQAYLLSQTTYNARLAEDVSARMCACVCVPERSLTIFLARSPFKSNPPLASTREIDAEEARDSQIDREKGGREGKRRDAREVIPLKRSQSFWKVKLREIRC